MASSTNALTKRYCALRGWPHACVQTFYGGRRHDLFGIADSIILRPPRMIWVQNCSYGTLKAHRDAIDASEYRKLLLELRVSVALWEWRRKKVGRKKLWFLRIQTLGGYGTWDEIQDWEGPIEGL